MVVVLLWFVTGCKERPTLREKPQHANVPPRAVQVEPSGASLKDAKALPEARHGNDEALQRARAAAAELAEALQAASSCQSVMELWPQYAIAQQKVYGLATDTAAGDREHHLALTREVIDRCGKDPAVTQSLVLH